MLDSNEPGLHPTESEWMGMRVIIFASTKINQNPNGNGRRIIRHDNSIIFIRNTSPRLAHKSKMAPASTFNSQAMDVPRNQTRNSHLIRKFSFH